MEVNPRGEDPNAVWQRVRREIQDALPAATFELWIAPLRASGSAAETLYLSAPGRVRAWVERRYLGTLEDALRRLAPDYRRIGLVDQRAGVRTVGTDPSRAPLLRGVPHDPAHTFDRFVIGPGNRIAHAAALAVAELPGEAYNPLFLHGPPGLGKSHLLGAIRAYMADHNPQLTVHHTTAEQFTTEFVAALRSEGPETFKRRYRTLDALLIDDVQVLEGKPATEEEFVNTFNALFAAGKQIVLSSDRSPGALSRLEQRLRDRFEWGLSIEIEPPDLRTRIALLWRFSAAALDQLPDPDALRELAARAPTNVRLLEGALTRVLAASSILGQPFADVLANRALPAGAGTNGVPASNDVVRAPSVAAILDAVSSVLGVSRADLLSPRRTPRIARARQLAMYLARELTPLSLAQIAREFDRDHSTVLYAVRTVQKRNAPESETANTIHRVRRLLGGNPRIDPE